MADQETPNQNAPIEIGTYVYVTDGQPAPPARFKRKRQDWECHNYYGVVTEYDRESDTYTVQSQPRDGWLTMRGVEILRSSTRRSKIRVMVGAPKVQVTSIGTVVRESAQAAIDGYYRAMSDRIESTTATA